MTRTRRRGWFDLPREERRAVLTMMWLVPALHVAVRVFDYRRTRAWLDRSSAQAAERTANSINALRLATSRVQVHSWLPGNCLSRSLALWWLLRRRGYAPELRLGVSMAGGTFAAHAWVELDGRVLNDRQDVATRYRPLVASPTVVTFD